MLMAAVILIAKTNKTKQKTPNTTPGDRMYKLWPIPLVNNGLLTLYTLVKTNYSSVLYG